MNNNLYNVCELAKYAADMSIPVEDLPVPEAGSEGVAGMTNNAAMNPASVGAAVYASPAEQMQLAKAKEIAAEAMAKQAAEGDPNVFQKGWNYAKDTAGKGLGWAKANPVKAGLGTAAALGAIGAGVYGYNRYKKNKAEQEKTAASTYEILNGPLVNRGQLLPSPSMAGNIIDQHRLGVNTMNTIAENMNTPKIDQANLGSAKKLGILSRAKNWVAKNPRYAGAAALGTLGALGAGAYAYNRYKKNKAQEKTAAEGDPNVFQKGWNYAKDTAGKGWGWAKANPVKAGLGTAAALGAIGAGVYGYNRYKNNKAEQEKTASAYYTGVYPEEAIYAMDSAEALYNDSLEKLAYAEELYADAANCLNYYDYMEKQANEFIPLAGSALGGAVGSVAGNMLGARFDAPRVGAALGAAVGAPAGAALGNFVNAARGVDDEEDPNAMY